MKIVIYVDYANAQFNKDFKLANVLIEHGHNVFFAVNDEQFEYFKDKCDKSICGYSQTKISYNADISTLNCELSKVVEIIDNMI